MQPFSFTHLDRIVTVSYSNSHYIVSFLDFDGKLYYRIGKDLGELIANAQRRIDVAITIKNGTCKAAIPNTMACYAEYDPYSRYCYDDTSWGR